jgi:RNA polymerase sigma factor (sigma-70 family)
MRMNECAPTIFLVDDDESVRKALSRLIRSAGYRIQEFSSAEEFLGYSAHATGSCLILDVRMPGLNGLELQERLAGEKLTLPIIFITGHGDIPMTVRAMKAGAIDFLAKPFEDVALLTAIENALARHLRVTQIKAQIDEIQSRADTLTPREREVMQLVITGMLNKQIAYQLGISEKTIKVHRARVMEKMQAGSVAELVRLNEQTQFRDSGP